MFILSNLKSELANQPEASFCKHIHNYTYMIRLASYTLANVLFSSTEQCWLGEQILW